MFGFDKAKYAQARDERGPDRHVGLELSRRARAPGTASSIPTRSGEAARRASSTSSRSTPSTSTPSRSTRLLPRAAGRRRHAAGPSGRRRVSSSRSSCIRSSRTRRCSRRRRARIPSISAPRTSTSSARRSIRSRRPASSARCSRSFRPASRTSRTHATTSNGCCSAFNDYPVAVELRHRSWSDDPADTLELLDGVRRGAGADRRAEVPVVDPPEPAAERADVLLHAAARPERRAVVEARQVRGPLQLPVFGRRAGAVRRSGARRRRAR